MMATSLAGTDRVCSASAAVLLAILKSCLSCLAEKLDVFDSDFNDSEGEDNEVFDDEVGDFESAREINIRFNRVWITKRAEK
jgi:hypothetical protein